MTSEAPAQRPARLGVGVVGCGRVGSVLGAALAAAGHPVLAASAGSPGSTERAEAMLPGVELLAPAEVVARADLAILAVPADALPGLVETLAAEGVVRPGQLLAHPVARFGTSVLESVVRQGVLPLALHPAMAFTGTSVDLRRLHDCCFGVTAPEPLLPIAQALVLEMGAEPQIIPEHARPLYSAALAVGSSSLATLVAESLDLLGRSGVGDPSRLLGPLVASAIDTTLRTGDAALAGPVADGDAATVSVQLRELEQVSATALSAYVSLARLTADRALSTGRLRPGSAEALLDVLADDTRSRP